MQSLEKRWSGVNSHRVASVTPNLHTETRKVFPA
jgi:hypothetical protein